MVVDATFDYDGVMTPTQTALAHPERVAVARLHALLELLPTALDHRLAGAGITAFEYSLLEALHEAPDTRMRLSVGRAACPAATARCARPSGGRGTTGLRARRP